MQVRHCQTDGWGIGSTLSCSSPMNFRSSEGPPFSSILWTANPRDPVVPNLRFSTTGSLGNSNGLQQSMALMMCVCCFPELGGIPWACRKRFVSSAHGSAGRADLQFGGLRCALDGQAMTHRTTRTIRTHTYYVRHM